MTTQPTPPAPGTPALGAEYATVCKTTDIAPGEGIQVMAMGGGGWRIKPMAVFNDNGTFYATNYVCPHMGGQLGPGGKIKDGVITCSWHGWSYSAETGEGVRAMGHSIDTYEVKVEDGNVLVKGVKSR